MVCRSILIMGLMVLALAASHANAIPCGQAIAKLMPCKPYLVGQANSVPPQCCVGASTLNGMVKSKPELEDLCKCLKQTAAELRVHADRAKALPGICRITVPVPIDPDVNCDAISTIDELFRRSKNVEVKANPRHF